MTAALTAQPTDSIRTLVIPVPGDGRLSIDLGSCFTVAAVAEDGEITDVTFDGIPVLSSAVALGPRGQVLTGRAAIDQARANPHTALRMPKRAVAAGAKVRLDGTSVLVADLVAAIIERVHTEATRHNARPREVIVCHPMAWTEAELAEIAVAAGIPGLSFVPEPIAAARHFRTKCPACNCTQNSQIDGEIAVYDFGMGLDIAIVRGDTVIGRPGGDVELGGDDLDERMMDLLADRAYQVEPSAWDSITDAEDKSALLRSQVSQARETLSLLLHVDVAVPGFAAPFRITRREFEVAARPDLERTAALTEAAITSAGFTAADVSAVTLAGAVSRTPAVSDVLAARFGALPALPLDPKAAVAHGALLTVATPHAAKDREPYLTLDPHNDDWLNT
jgi:molecular chaperone DnaK (HSP70)